MILTIENLIYYLLQKENDSRFSFLWQDGSKPTDFSNLKISLIKDSDNKKNTLFRVEIDDYDFVLKQSKQLTPYGASDLKDEYRFALIFKDHNNIVPEVGFDDEFGVLFLLYYKSNSDRVNRKLVDNTSLESEAKNYIQKFDQFHSFISIEKIGDKDELKSYFGNKRTLYSSFAHLLLEGGKNLNFLNDFYFRKDLNYEVKVTFLQFLRNDKTNLLLERISQYSNITGLIHGDLNESNIIRESGSGIKIIDLECASFGHKAWDLSVFLVTYMIYNPAISGTDAFYKELRVQFFKSFLSEIVNSLKNQGFSEDRTFEWVELILDFYALSLIIELRNIPGAELATKLIGLVYQVVEKKTQLTKFILEADFSNVEILKIIPY